MRGVAGRRSARATELTWMRQPEQVAQLVRDDRLHVANEHGRTVDRPVVVDRVEQDVRLADDDLVASRREHHVGRRGGRRVVSASRTGVATAVPTAHVRPHGRSIRVGASSLRVAA
jgi:hypothetical protein